MYVLHHSPRKILKYYRIGIFCLPIRQHFVTLGIDFKEGIKLGSDIKDELKIAELVAYKRHRHHTLLVLTELFHSIYLKVSDLERLVK